MFLRTLVGMGVGMKEKEDTIQRGSGGWGWTQLI